MKLEAYVKASGQGCAGSLGFNSILGFVFGEKYQIITGRTGPTGRGIIVENVFEFSDLQVILNILGDEFEPRTDVVPEMVITTSRDIDKMMGMPHGTAIGASSMRAAAVAALGSTPQTPGLGMKGTADDRILLVRQAPASPAFERPTMDCYLEMFRSQITMYNLTQSWDQMEGRANL